MLTTLRRFELLDWISAGVFLAGIICVSTGLLPAAAAWHSVCRIGPLLLFLGSVTILATLAGHAQLFDVIAARLAIVGRGNYRALFFLCTGLAALTTMLLNLDTTAVLLAPVLLALAGRVQIDAFALAMTTIWLANTASVLLPVSNLTNLLAQERLELSAVEFAGRMWAPQLAALLVMGVLLWTWCWNGRNRGRARYVVPVQVKPERPVLFWVAVAACSLFAAAVLLVPESAIGFAALGAALIVVLAFAFVDRKKLGRQLFPGRLLLLVTGLFLVVPTLTAHGLGSAMSWLIGPGDGGIGSEFRAALTGAGLSNIVNNLPAYAAGEAVIPAGNPDQLLALLIGTNVGPVITPWASLASLLCLEACRRQRVRVPMWEFAGAGLVLAIAAVAAAVSALVLTA